MCQVRTGTYVSLLVPITYQYSQGSTQERENAATLPKKVQTKKESECSDFCANRENDLFHNFCLLGFSIPPLSLAP